MNVTWCFVALKNIRNIPKQSCYPYSTRAWPLRKQSLILTQHLLGSERMTVFSDNYGDIGVEIIAMHYGIGWGERQRVFP